MPIARSIQIIGLVQGVFFREWTVQLASQLGIDGWVRNHRVGAVQIYAAGSPAQMDRFIAELRQGSPASRVDEVIIESAALEPVSGFTRRASC